MLSAARRSRRRRMLPVFGSLLILSGLLPAIAGPVAADSTAQLLPFSQSWSNVGLITANDNWSGVPGAVGFLGQDITTGTGTDPQTLLTESLVANDVDVIANQTNPTTLATGGVAEFEITDSVVALNGSGTADAPHLLLNLNTSGNADVTVAYNLRDLDASIDNSIQPVALQYRVGSSGSFTNIPGGFVADATTGPSLATQVTPVSATLPAAADSQPLVQVRIITANAVGNDEWVGIDDISITGSTDSAPDIISSTPADGASGVALNTAPSFTFDEPVTVDELGVTLVCDVQGAKDASLGTADNVTFTLTTSNFVEDDECTLAVAAAAVSDTDAIDPPDDMDAPFSATFTTVASPGSDDAPTVLSTTPANGATGVAIGANVSVTFSEPVNIAGTWFTISCASSGNHAAVISGGPTTFTLNPDLSFTFGELCTTTIVGSLVTDQDSNDPPNEMAANHVFSFTTTELAVLTLPYTQAWTNTGAITTTDDWSGVPGVAGFLGQAITGATGADPQTLLTESTAGGDVDVIANQTNPNTLASGGVAEFEIANPVVALQGSGTADAPYVLINFSTSGLSNVVVSYNLRDIDGSADDAVQAVALQYRIGSTGSFTNIPSAFVADATTGPSLATQVTAVSATLPAAADNQPIVQVRIITSNAVGSDEWVGIDDISIAEVSGDVAPSVSSTDPAHGASNVALDASLTVTFSEPVNVDGAWFDITCTNSGAHTAVAGSGTTTFVIDPDVNFSTAETCTLTIDAASVTDTDTADPPDEMDTDKVVTFTTVGATVAIHDIQGATHVSPRRGESVVTSGIVTAKRPTGFYVQDPSPDSDDATSEAIFVFTGTSPTVNVGDAVSVAGTVAEFRPGNAANNLSTTQITGPSISVVSTGNSLPPTSVIGIGGRVPPNTVIEDDAAGDVETSGVFDPAADGIDFYESLEGMRVQVNNPVAVGPRNSFGEIFVLADDGANASLRTVRGGIVIRPTDFNPERIQFDDAVLAGSTPNANVGDHFTTAAVGVMDYDFGNFEIELTSALTTVPGGLAREVTEAAGASELSVATFNVENLDANEPQAKFDALAAMIVTNLSAPDVIALEEIQDNNGATNDAVTDANLTLGKLRDAIVAAGGPTYDWRQINPVDDQDGGEPGGNIRVGFMFRTDRGLAFVDRPGGGSTTPTTIVSGVDGPELSSSPGRVDPTNTAWNASRKPLAGEFTFGGETFFLIANHFNSKGGDQPLFGHFQPPARSSEVQRHQQAQIVNDFVDSILAVDSDANVIVIGDINDFEFSTTMSLLKGGVLNDLIDALPPNERYSYVFEGNSQVLDHIVVSNNLFTNIPFEFDPVHANAEFFDQLSDHDPSVARFLIAGAGTVVVNKTGVGDDGLPGAGFTLFVDAAPTGDSRGAEDTTAAGGCTTGVTGSCSIMDVSAGAYWLVETTTPNGYSTHSPTAVTVDVGPSPGVGDTETVNLSNDAVPGTVVVNKTGHGGAALSGARFTLFVDDEPMGGSPGAGDDEAAGDCTTNGAGTCSISNIPLGVYWLVETTTPNGYTTANPTQVIVGLGSAPNTGDTDTVNLTNTAVAGTVVINKSGHGGAALPGAGFTLYVDATPVGDSRGEEDVTAAGSCTTNSGGTCSILSVPLGTYWLVETTTPNGYATVNPTQITVGLGPAPDTGDTDTVNLSDTAVPGTVVVDKRGQGRAIIVDVTFTLYHDATPTGGGRGPEDTSSAGSCVTVASAGGATCSILNVPIGAHWLVETVPPGNAPVNPIAVTVGLGASPGTGDTDTITVMNKPKGSPRPR